MHFLLVLFLFAAAIHSTLQGPVQKVAATDKKIVCFFSSWAVYRTGDGEFNVGNIDPFLCTHYIYAFAGIDNTTHKIVSLDPYNDLPDNFGKGSYLLFTNLSNTNPALKTILAVGGSNEGSQKYSIMASTAENRQAFVDSAVAFLKKYGFDGLDLDWEYPTLNGGAPEDKDNFVELLKELRAAFDPEGLSLSAAVAAGKSNTDQAYDVPNFTQYVDFFTLMTYDYHGTWESYTGENAPLNARPDETGGNLTLNVNYSVNYWLQLGAPAEKLTLGLPAYGHNWELKDPQQHGFYAPTIGPGTAGPYTAQPGTLGYNELCVDLADWSVIFDEDYAAPYAFLNEQWMSYDNEESITDKVGLVNSLGLGGVSVWSIETDDFHGYCGGTKFPLITAAVNQLQGGASNRRK